jgi:hypothetical protein
VEFRRRKKRDEEKQGHLEVVIAMETPCEELIMEIIMISGGYGLALVSIEEEQLGQV